MVSLIQSNFANFGSGLVPEGAGFALQSRAGLFSLDPAHPNALAPRKRPLQTVIPAFMKRDHLRVGFGVMGDIEPLVVAKSIDVGASRDMNGELAAVKNARISKCLQRL